MASCCVCNKSRPFAFSPALRECTVCRQSYHVDCHSPPLNSDAPTEFECSSCERVVRERSPGKPPRKRPRIEYSTCEEPKPDDRTCRSAVTNSGYKDHHITKRDAINLIRQKNPHDHQLLHVLDRYIAKTASRNERAWVKGKIKDIALELIKRSPERYIRASSPPPQAAKKPKGSPLAATGGDLRERPGVDTEQSYKASANLSQNDRLPRSSGFKSSQAVIENQSSIITPKDHPPQTKLKVPRVESQPPAIIDLTNEDGDEDVADAEHVHVLSAKSSADLAITGPYASRVDPKTPAQKFDPRQDTHEHEHSVTPKTNLDETEPLRPAIEESAETERHVLLARIGEFWQRIEELETTKQSHCNKIGELQEEVSTLKSQLSLAKQELMRKQPIETSLQSTHPSIILPIRNSQGDNPPTILSPESDSHSPTLPNHLPDEHEKEVAHLKSQLLKEQLAGYEKQQQVNRLERKLEEAEVGRKVPVSRIAHTNIIRGMPTGLPKTLSGEELKSPRLSRKQCSSRVNMHRANERRTKLQTEPIRWNARDQGDRFRPKIDYDGVDGSNDRQLNHMLNSPADSNSNASSENDTEGNDEDGFDDDPARDGSLTTSNGIEIANSSNELSSTSEEGERLRPVTRATAKPKGLTENDGESRARRATTPEAVKAAHTFEHAFGLDSDAVPVVVDCKLAFRTTDNARGSRSRAAQNDVYRVGRDVLGEMR